MCPVTYGATELYLPPEAYNLPTRYNARVADLFACGIILYMMTQAGLPFKSARKNIDPNYTRLCARAVSNQHTHPLQELIDRMLIDDLEQRYTMEQVRAHPWMQGELATQEQKTQFFKQRL